MQRTTATAERPQKSGQTSNNTLMHWCPAYHDGEGVLAHGLMVQPLGRVQDARAGVQAELLEAEGVGAAQQGEGQLVLLILVGGDDPQDLGVGRRVLSHADVVALLGELGPVVVGVDDADQHLLGRHARTSRQGLREDPLGCSCEINPSTVYKGLCK